MLEREFSSKPRAARLQHPLIRSRIHRYAHNNMGGVWSAGKHYTASFIAEKVFNGDTRARTHTLDEWNFPHTRIHPACRRCLASIYILSDATEPQHILLYTVNVRSRRCAGRHDMANTAKTKRQPKLGKLNRKFLHAPEITNGWRRIENSVEFEPTYKVFCAARIRSHVAYVWFTVMCVYEDEEGWWQSQRVCLRQLRASIRISHVRSFYIFDFDAFKFCILYFFFSFSADRTKKISYDCFYNAICCCCIVDACSVFRAWFKIPSLSSKQNVFQWPYVGIHCMRFAHSVRVNKVCVKMAI